MTRDEAIADLAGAINDGEIGSEYLIDGKAVFAVRRSLSQEEMDVFSGGGLLTEGCRITADSTMLEYEPVTGGTIDIDGIVYDIKSVQKSGIKRRITCLRYLS